MFALEYNICDYICDELQGSFVHTRKWYGSGFNRAHREGSRSHLGFRSRRQIQSISIPYSLDSTAIAEVSFQCSGGLSNDQTNQVWNVTHSTASFACLSVCCALADTADSELPNSILNMLAMRRDVHRYERVPRTAS